MTLAALFFGFGAAVDPEGVSPFSSTLGFFSLAFGVGFFGAGLSASEKSPSLSALTFRFRDVAFLDAMGSSSLSSALSSTLTFFFGGALALPFVVALVALALPLVAATLARPLEEPLTAGLTGEAASGVSSSLDESEMGASLRFAVRDDPDACLGWAYQVESAKGATQGERDDSK